MDLREGMRSFYIAGDRVSLGITGSIVSICLGMRMP